MAVEVPCPGCGLKLKAPENMAGKKAKCKRCATSFHLPGSAPAGEPAGEEHLLSVAALPSPLPLDDDPPPAREVASLPSADPFDFSTPPAKSTSKVAPASHPPAPKPVARAAPAAPPVPRPASGTVKAAPASPAPTPAKAAPAPAAKPAAPRAKVAPAAEPLPLDDEPLPADETIPSAEADTVDPSLFDTSSGGVKKPRGRRRDRDGDDRPRRSRDDEDDPKPGGRRYVRPGDKKPGNTLLIAGVIGVVALLAVAAAVVVYVRERREDEQARKKDEPPAPPPAEAAKDDGKGGKKDPKDSKEPKEAPKKDTKEPPKKEPGVPALPAFALPAAARAVQLRPPPAKPAVVQKPAGTVTRVEGPGDQVRQVFPADAGGDRDAVVVWVSDPGVGGKGQKLTADSYSATTGAKVGRFEFDGDGGAVVRCDVSPDGKQFAAAGPDGKVDVWDLAGGTKAVEGFDPYAEFADHKKDGLAAVFFTRAPGRLLTVSTAGAVHLFDLAARKKIEVTRPSGVALAPNKVTQGRNVAADDDRGSIVLAAYGKVYQIDTATLKTVREVDLKGEVARPLGIGVAGSPGRVAFAFETDANGKKDMALMLCPQKGDPEFYRWPTAAGDPSAVSWLGSEAAVVSAANGALWVEYSPEGKRLVPLAFAQVPGGKGLHAATDKAHWYLAPDPAMPKGSLLLSLDWPPEGNIDYRNAAAEKGPLHVVQLDHDGLSR